MSRVRARGWTLVLIVVLACSGGNSEDVGNQGVNLADGGLTADMDPSSAAEADASDTGSAVGVPACGDGVLGAEEQCDEGPRNGRDEPGACRADCTRPVCGDERVDPGEQCDTGSARSAVVSDACRPDCRAARCGDGVVDRGEQCDGNGVATDACRANCGFPRCGDGVRDEGEACDDGPNNSDARPGACRTTCTIARCGDGVRDQGEDCDDGPANSDYEPNACRRVCERPQCGDGVLDMGERCDTGPTSMLADKCRPSCVLPRCGDGVVDTGEACDDGNTVDADRCRNDCSTARCGDLTLDPGEACDDGNRNSGDGCQATCLLPVCGDGVVDPGEACDDANMFDNDGCRSNCQPGCVSAGACDDALFCNGREQCVAGLCQPGTPPVLDDGVACTTDRCDEDADRVVNEGRDASCTPSASRCEQGVRTGFAAMCMPTRGCQEVPRTEACPDAPSTCTPGSGRDMLLTTFVPACAGGDCGAPRATPTPCVAPAPRCDPATRVGTIARATCDARSETCGSELAERNDCAALDARSCSADGRTFRGVTGQCTPMGTCTSDTSEQACEQRGPSCVDGMRTEFDSVCEPQRGCLPARARAGVRCPAPAALCEGTNDARVHVRFEASCADPASCDPDGEPIRTDCEGRAASCADGTLSTYAPRCDANTGCGTPTVAGTMRCPVAAPLCDPTPDGFVHRRFEPGCSEGTRCDAAGRAIDTRCAARLPSCEGGALVRFEASCDPASGCGAAIPGERTPCPARAPVCNPTPEGFLHVAYAPSCVDGTRCSSDGAATIRTCAGNALTCEGGMLTRTQASCSPEAGCGAATVTEASVCPADAPRCVPLPNGFLHTAYAPACEGTGACLPRGIAMEDRCLAPAAVCVDATITTMAATCDPAAGCGLATGVSLPCSARASSCEAIPNGFRLTRYAPACANGASCVVDGVPSSQECRAAGAVCADGAIRVSTPTCDATRGCGVDTTPPMPCPALPATCTPAGAGYVYTRYAPSCLDGARCVETGAPQTLNCQGTSQVCEAGVLRGTVATCDVATGCGTVPAMELPCPVSAPICETVNGQPVHVRFSAGCADGTSCAPGGIAQRETCVAPPPRCEAGKLTTFEPTCTPMVAAASRRA